MHDRDFPERSNEAGWFRLPRVKAGLNLATGVNAE